MSVFTTQRSRSPWPWLLAAALLLLASLAARWPGVAMYDSVSQYEQAMAGDYTDWHPPIMARAWALLHPLGPGGVPFFLIQLLAWWGGLGALAAALGMCRRHGAAALVLLAGAAPLWLGWVTVVLKDAQMAACLVAATALVGWWRIADRPLPRPAAALALVPIAYATLVRGNAVFATVPFALALLGWPGLPRMWQRCAAVAAGVLAVLAAGPLVNHRLLGAEPTHVERALPLYDMAGIAHFGGLATLPGATARQWRDAERRGCYSPYFWNPYGEPAQCDALGRAVAMGEGEQPHLLRHWAALVLAHPVAYLRHRFGHLNANLRFWVGPGEGDGAPPLVSERNPDGLGGPAGPANVALVAVGRAMALTPLGWPCVWLAVALALLWASAGRRAVRGEGQAALGRALALSAACMSASFAVVSIASDLRYHLWSMVAAALATVLLVDAGALRRRRAFAGASAVALVAFLAGLAHFGAAAPVYAPTPGRIVPAAAQP